MEGTPDMLMVQPELYQWGKRQALLTGTHSPDQSVRRADVIMQVGGRVDQGSSSETVFFPVESCLGDCHVIGGLASFLTSV